jgi:tRNA A-37 threonylcarbamoyl transferase component Bud32
MPSHVSGVIRPTVVVEGKNTITKQTIDADRRGCAPVNVEIVSKPDMKYLKIEHKRTTEGRSFIHGMNLWNFRLLNGKYPTKVDKMVEKAVKEMDRFHDDLRPWNFILDGEKVHPIDFEDKLWRKTPEKEALKKCLKLLKMDVDYDNPKFSRLLRTV